MTLFPRQRRLGCLNGCPAGYHEEPCPKAGTGRSGFERMTNEFRCNACLSFTFGERERLESCHNDRRCPLAGSIVGGGSHG